MTIWGWVGNAFIVGGLWGVGNKWRPAFALSVVGECCWIYASWLRAQWDLMAVCVVFAVLAARSFVKWGQP